LQWRKNITGDMIGLKKPAFVLGLALPIYIWLSGAACAQPQWGSQTREEKVLAAALFNNALAQIRKGNHAEAVALLDQVDKIIPGNFDVVSEEGYSLETLGRWQEAKEKLERAVKIRSDDCHAWRALGIAYEQLGAVDKAKNALMKYVEGADDKEDAKIMRAHIQLIEETIKKKAADPDKADDYLADISKEYKTPWIDEKRSPRVFIASGAGVAGYKDSYRQSFLRAMETWNKVLDGRITLTPVDDKSKADIEVSWSAKPPAAGCEGGETTPWVRNGRMGRATMIIFTVLNGFQPTNVDLYALELHELGHALGLGGHSTNPGDIMYPSSAAIDQKLPSLSARDIASVRRLYAQTSPTIPKSTP
jgi:tetratricopeptide (TPR) repeat protein